MGAINSCTKVKLRAGFDDFHKLLAAARLQTFHFTFNPSDAISLLLDSVVGPSDGCAKPGHPQTTALPLGRK